MARLSLQGQGNLDQIANHLSREIQQSALSCSLIDQVVQHSDNLTVWIMVFEKYYMRSSNRASLTVIISGRGDQIIVDAIGAGGGQGALFRFSWGAEEDFVNTVAKVLRPYGFQPN